MKLRSAEELEEIGRRAAESVSYLHPDYDVTVNVDIDSDAGQIIGGGIITNRTTGTRRRYSLEGVYYLLVASEKSALSTLQAQITAAVGRMQNGVWSDTDKPDKEGVQS
jgi:hypothetical protein